MDIDEEMRVMRQKEREADQTQYNARLEELQKERVREQEVLSSRFEEERQRLVSSFETLQATLQATMEGRYKEQIADLTTKLAESSLQVRQLIQAEVNPVVSLMTSQAANRGPRQRLEAVKSFSGKKRDLAMWKVDILAKLFHDGEAIGSPTAPISLRLQPSRQRPEELRDSLRAPTGKGGPC